MAGRAGGPIARPSAFWDSSPLVSLCANQDSTPQALQWQERYEIVVWWATPVEIAAALARLLRTRHLNARQWRESTRLARELTQMWSVVEPSLAIRAKAVEIVQNYDLRAGDSLQLAAALEWCNNDPRGHRFLSGDRKLRDAAMLNGFET